MKMNYLMKGMAVMALGLVAVSCNKMDSFDPYAEQEIKQEEFTNNFQSSVLNGKSIDANQTWSTAEKASVNVKVSLNYGEDYTVYVLTDNPTINPAADYLGVTSIKSGSSAAITIAKPSDLNHLYVACVNSKGNYFVQLFEMEGTTASVNIGGDETPNAAPRRAATTVNGESVQASSYIVTDKTYWKNDLLNYSTYDGYYDLTQVNPQHYDKLCYGINNETNNGNKPIYGDGKHFIVPAGETVTGSIFNWNDGGGDDHVIVVKGTLVVTGSMKLDNGKSIYVEAGGKLEYKGSKFEIANTSRLVNYGTVEFTNTYVDYANGPNYWGGSSGSTAMYGKTFYNGGTIKESSSSSKSSFNFAGGGNTNNQLTYYNEGNIELHAFQFNAQATLVNVGHIKADTGKDGATQLTDLSASGQNGTVINICDMAIKMYAFNKYIGCNGSLLYCESGLMTNNAANIYLGSQAMIKVGDWYHNGGNCYGASSANDYSIIKVTGSLNEVNGGASGSQGYVYFDVNDILGKGSKDGEGAWHISQVNEKMLLKTVSEATAPDNITIPSDEDGCNYIGFHEGNGNKTFQPSYIYYAFEDLGTTDDFDFNDVVIRVSTPDAQGTSSVELMAAGGTLPTYVTYGTGDSPNTLGGEVHQEFGVETGVMVNTGKGETKPIQILGIIQGLSADTDMSNLPLGIKVNGYNGQVTRVVRSAANTGNAPLVIVVNGYTSGDNVGKWFWPLERTNISSAYGQFGEWGADVSKNQDWYKNISGSVYRW